MSASFIIDPLDNLEDHRNVYQSSIRTRPLSPRVLHFVSAGTAAAVSCALYNPLDCLRVRWQVLGSASPQVSSGIISFGRNIVRTEGVWEGLWRPGLSANVIGMAGSSAIRLGYYESVRNALDEIVGSDDKTRLSMLVAGLLCGSAGYLMTTPFHLLKTIIQAEKGTAKPFAVDFVPGALRIVSENGILSLWKGALPLTYRGALFTSGQMIGYDGFKTWAKSEGFKDGPFLHVLSSVSASFGASMFSAPADFIMAKYMSSMASTGTRTSVYQCIKETHMKEGIRGFW
eukprot:CAMPEP_0195526958 /NCGR_PEP_ID=MMETSP0794_2-20130614/28315_1 /TAXON_ID=515487 /ORGANISM="Stephanopyxis turris, Strain CCMP 815" /LENGTH=286 /DNA_ID=CAMNT_0040657757 /DNA_START=197 /DNA_END=1054 /DNA_ORIENTATION=-